MVKTLSQAEIAEAAQALADDELVVAPTARWYMVCGRARCSTTASRIFRAKARPNSKVLMLCLGQPDWAEELFLLTDEARVLAAHFWPGDLLLKLRWRSQSQSALHPGVGEPIALVGVPNDPLGDLARALGEPLVASSANVSGDLDAQGTEPAISVDEARRFVELSSEPIRVVVDGGIAPQARHLTVVDASRERASLEREGTLHPRAVAAALGRAL
ncbi:Sua5/YciO/YrdC/YwlC family protein [Gaiella occulta]|uniref:Sua5/YciO/YrdC/YwlC family protein n=1 Tax=Gaiella occulta TaxID=1002870 RepID=UPI000E0C6BED